MKIKVDHERCQGHAMCYSKAPRVFVIDDDGYNRMLPFTVPKELEEEARKGVGACPELAISIVED